MKNFLILLLLFAQGIAAQVINLDGNTTRAVVIGISDYQDEGIPDLRFAHRDAEAFVAWLRSPAGGSLPDDNIQLLLNEKATKAQFAAALDWLREQSKEGDQALIYFSGHGDVDSKIIGQEGFLLFWDTPSQSYISGAYPLYFLKLVISTLSLQNKAKVVMIADACRAGKLAGNAIGGAQITNENLRQQFAHEIKILSCQPNEVSIEGEGWGGGRGVFSYHLLDGMYGMADGNTDGQVTLSEIDRYLEDHVSKEVDPMQQTPMIVGDKKERLAQVFPDVLALWKKGKVGQPVQFKQVEQRGLEDETLAKVDTSIRKLYFAFKRAVQEKVFLEPADSCANAYYEKLMAVAELKPLHGAMTRNFAAALMDDAQQWINKFLQSSLVGGEWKHPKSYDRYLARAAELLGEGHYMYGNLKGKEYLFKARDVLVEKRWTASGMDSLDLVQFHQYLRHGLAYDDKAPYIYFHLTYGATTRNENLEAIELLKKAIELAPSWVRANWTIGNFYLALGKYHTAGVWYDKAKALDEDGKDPYLKSIVPDYFAVIHDSESHKKSWQQLVNESKKQFESEKNLKNLNDYAGVCWAGGYPEEGERLFEQIVDSMLNSDKNYAFLESLEKNYNELGWLNLVQGKYAKAKEWFQKSLETDSLSFYACQTYAGLALLSYLEGHEEQSNHLFQKSWNGYCSDPYMAVLTNLFLFNIYDMKEESVLMFQKALEQFPDDAPLRYHLGRIYLEQLNDPEKGIAQLQECVRLDEGYAYAHYHLAAAYAHLGKKQAALDYLEKALEKGYEDFEQMEKDVRWERLRGTKRYREILKKYQSKHHKD